jgi:hypothetical protein
MAEKNTADLLKELHADGAKFPLCGYGAHSWVRGERLERDGHDLYLKNCVNGCGGQYFCSWQEWQLLPRAE